MEIIIFIAVVVGAVLLWNGYAKAKKADSDQTIDNWQPPKAEDKPWPYGEKVAEGKIHVKSSDVAPADSEPQVETSVSTVSDITAENKAEAVAKIKKAPVKKEPVKKAAAKAPRKPKTV